MLYSEIRERENRFATALKIVFPFLLLVGIFLFTFKFFSYKDHTFILITLLIPIYVYYIFYLIYTGFKTSVLDPTTKAFTRKKIISYIETLPVKDKYTLVLLHVENLVDINERYGVSNGDKVLKALLVLLNVYLQKHHFKNCAIGRCGGDKFLIPIKGTQKELTHLFSFFINELKHKGMLNIELKLESAMIEADYDSDVKNCIERLIMLLDESKKSEEEPLNIKPDEFEYIVLEAIKHNCISFKYQPSLHVKHQKIELFEVLPKIETKVHGTLSKKQIERIVNYSGHEKMFDEKMITCLVEEVAPYLHQESLLSLEISPVTLRNNSFKQYINTLFREKKINPKHFMFEFTEKNSYEDMNRFKEIIESYQVMGFSIALNNFGGNNCGVEYLKYLPIDMIKFDIEFTKKMEEQKYTKIIQNYLSLAQQLGIKTMIKFVDKELLYQRVEALNPDYIQGFYVEKPKKIGELNEIW